MERLSDPCNDRVIDQVKPPPHKPLLYNMLFSKPNKPNWKLLKTHFAEGGRITKSNCLAIITLATQLFRQERNLLDIRDPVTVVGDIHGQYYDLLKILEVGGDPEQTGYLFLGDYVDRGSFSIEVILLLYSMKINLPSTIWLLRGNHECRQMTSFFNFRTECLDKFDQEIYDAFMESFDSLPVACLVNGKFLGIHGGISPDLETLMQINMIDRFQEPPRAGVFCDVLWSDPTDAETGEQSDKYKRNETRGCSYVFGVDAINEFLQRNRLLSLFRAHEAQLDGYKLHKWNGPKDFPVVITVFSAPNYCDVYKNKGAIVKFSNNAFKVEQYGYTDHPYLLPNFLDIFTWSLPFVSEKVLEILMVMLKDREGEEEDEEEKMQRGPQLRRQSGVAIFKKNILADKALLVKQIMKLVSDKKEKHETLVNTSGLVPDDKVPKELIIEGASYSNPLFHNAKKKDSINEKRPLNF